MHLHHSYLTNAHTTHTPPHTPPSHTHNTHTHIIFSLITCNTSLPPSLPPSLTPSLNVIFPLLYTFLSLLYQRYLRELMGLRCRILLTHIDGPVGTMTGQSLEIQEAIWCLNGDSSSELTELVCTLGKGWGLKVSPAVNGE